VQVKDISNYDWAVQKRAPAVPVPGKNNFSKHLWLTCCRCFFYAFLRQFNDAVLWFKVKGVPAASNNPIAKSLTLAALCDKAMNFNPLH
jgi:hypothetical protein